SDDRIESVEENTPWLRGSFRKLLVLDKAIEYFQRIDGERKRKVPEIVDGKQFLGFDERQPLVAENLHLKLDLRQADRNMKRVGLRKRDATGSEGRDHTLVPIDFYAEFSSELRLTQVGDHVNGVYPKGPLFTIPCHLK